MMTYSQLLHIEHNFWSGGVWCNSSYASFSYVKWVFSDYASRVGLEMESGSSIGWLMSLDYCPSCLWLLWLFSFLHYLSSADSYHINIWLAFDHIWLYNFLVIRWIWGYLLDWHGPCHLFKTAVSSIGISSFPVSSLPLIFMLTLL